jgi:hypothetical protein
MQAKIKLAIKIIKGWLVDTGALAGERASGFKADWSAACNEPYLINWWRHNRGGNELADLYPGSLCYSAMVARQYRALIALLDNHNPETDSLQYRLQNAFSDDVRKSHQQQKECEEQRKFMQACSLKTKPELMEKEQELLNRKKMLILQIEQFNAEVAWHNRQCKETNNPGHKVMYQFK